MINPFERAHKILSSRGDYMINIGEDNRDRIREFFRTHIGCTNRECGKALNVSEFTIGRHIKEIRKEWL